MKKLDFRKIGSKAVRKYRLLAGGDVGRATGAPVPAVPVSIPQPAVPAADYNLAAPYFDAAFYLTKNEDVRQEGADPLEHFLMHGWREGRDPAPSFSVADYLDMYPDIGLAGVNPFLHYLIAGKSEGREPLRKIDFRSAYLWRTPCPPDNGPEADPPGFEGDRAALEAALADLPRSGGKKLIVTVSHDDFRVNLGGVQSCLVREAQGFAARGIDHIHLFPGRPTDFVRDGNPHEPLGVLVNDMLVGQFGADQVVAAFADCGVAEVNWRSFAVHSLLGHDASAVAAALTAAGMRRGYFWIHDFASICSGYNLLRNDIAFCGAPPADSPACTICRYGESRERQVARHRMLFERFEMVPVAPSAATARLWAQANAFGAPEPLVRPHGTLLPGEAEPEREVVAETDGPLRVAYLGLGRMPKGWPVFQDLLRALEGDPRYDFYHLGLTRETGLAASFIRVAATPDHLDAMSDAVRQHAIDVAIVWSLCPETFCLTAHEAIVGGAALITSPDSGNVAALAAARPEGRVFASEAEMVEAFRSGAVLELARSARPAPATTMVFGAGTADLLDANAA